MDLFKGYNGMVSSKRIGGLILLICGLIGYFSRLDVSVTTTLILTGGGLLGIGVLEKK